RLLGDAVDRESSLRAGASLLAAEGEGAGDAGVGFELGGELGEAVGAEEGVIVEHADGPTGLFEAGLGEPLGAADGLDDVRGGVLRRWPKQPRERRRPARPPWRRSGR